MTTSNPSLSQVRAVLGVTFDSIGRTKRGTFIARRGFFYTNRLGADEFERAVRAAFPKARIVDVGEVWKPFRGGATVAQGSHWFVEFSFEAAQVQGTSEGATA